MLMYRRLLFTLGVLFFTATPPSNAHAQQLQSARFHEAPFASALGTPNSSRPRTWTYVVGGAVAGAVLAGGLTALELSKSSDALMGPVVVGVATVSGAILGGGIGWAVHRIRYRRS
jgi:hypothetical protein